MPPHRENLGDESDTTSTPIQDLMLALNELMQLQRQQTSPIMLDTRFQHPKFSRQMNGDMVDSWIRSFSTYFKASPQLQEAAKLQIASLQLEGVAQAWRDTQVDHTVLTVDIGSSTASHTCAIASWDAFYDALHNRFYPPGYRQGLHAHWLQLRQLSEKFVQAFIDIFCKLQV